jgi:hypothetical protein
LSTSSQPFHHNSASNVDQNNLISNVPIQVAIFSQLTRWELASLINRIPKVGMIHNPTLQVLYGSFKAIDPFTLLMRPGDHIVMEGGNLLDQHRMSRKSTPSGIFIQGFGSFSIQGLSIFKKMSFISESKMKVSASAESRWMASNDYFSFSDKELIMKALWHTTSNKPILQFQRKCIDPMNYCEIIGERYIDNFVIDICIGKYLEEANKQGYGNTLYLPTELFCWMTSDDKAFKYQKLSERLSLMATNFTQILMPVHFENASHWGLVYVDLINNQIMFDDGMKFYISQHKHSKLQEALDILSELCPSNDLLQTKFWPELTVRKCGMPRQIGSGLVGGGSCGVGVILAARDFIFHGSSAVHNIKWKYSEMYSHRSDLLIKIARDWKNGN